MGLFYWWSTRWCYLPNIKALGLVVSDDKKIFYILALYKLMYNTCDRGGGGGGGGGGIFGPRGII